MQTTPIEPQFKSRPRTKPLTTVVMHATAGSTLEGAVETLHDKGYGYHYIIDKDGTVHKGCITSRACAHAGESRGPNGRSVNGYSLGICWVNLNDGEDPLTPAQIKAAGELVKTLADAIPSLEWVCTHWALTVKPNGSARKTDPRGCPLSALASEAGLKPWKPDYAARYSL